MCRASKNLLLFSLFTSNSLIYKSIVLVSKPLDLLFNSGFGKFNFSYSESISE